jgi:hypothetical protein
MTADRTLIRSVARLGRRARPDLAPRIDRALALAEAGMSIRRGDGAWRVASSRGDGSAYRVSDNGRACSCPDFAVRRRPCKHLLAVRLLLAAERLSRDEEVALLILRLASVG